MTSRCRRRSEDASDVLTAVVPYVPSDELPFLPEMCSPTRPLVRSTADLRDAVPRCGPAEAAADVCLKPGGSVVLEIGGQQGG